MGASRLLRFLPVVLAHPPSSQIVDPTPQWYSVPTPSPSASAPKPSPALIGTMHARAQTLLDKENALHAASLDPKTRSKDAVPAPTGLSKADQVFIQQVLSSGTSSDKVSALLLLISSSPLHNKTYLDQIAALCKKKSRDESGRAVRGVVDWWRGEGGGSPDRKLRYFADQPALPVVAEAYEGKPSDLTKEDLERTLVLYAFEDWFKRWFFQVLQALEVRFLLRFVRSRD
jgi:ribosome biogenesis protein MAK21